MFFMKPNIQDLVNNDSFKSLLKIMKGKDEVLAKEAALGIGKNLTGSCGGTYIKEEDDNREKRLSQILLLDSTLVVEVLFSMFENGYTGQLSDRIIKEIISRSRFNRLLSLLDNSTLKKHSRWSVLNAIFHVAIMLNNHSIAVDVISRLDSKDDDQIVLLHSEEKELVEIIIKGNIPENNILELLKSTNSGRATEILFDVLKEVGSEASINCLKTLPNIKYGRGAYMINTKDSASLTISYIETNLKFKQKQTKVKQKKDKGEQLISKLENSDTIQKTIDTIKAVRSIYEKSIIDYPLGEENHLKIASILENIFKNSKETRLRYIINDTLGSMHELKDLFRIYPMGK